ncbi:MAG TPA: hypothetical protein VKM55_18180 [Candidatus Lokiarchaeia archaeon]|nr:hypothetical protein [Candidatus Lokiarchaeia archaeon]
MLLSNFNVLLGPTIEMSVPAMNPDDKNFDIIPRFIDLVDSEQFFISTAENAYSANYYFTIANTAMRGNENMLLMSIAIQVEPSDDKEKILLFLKNTENILEQHADFLKNDETITKHGVFASETKDFVSGVLHKLHEEVFVKREFGKLFEVEYDKIGVFAPRGFDASEIIDPFRATLASEYHPTLKTRMILNTLKELEFMKFECLDRQSDTCLKDQCPVCKEIALESSGAIYIFDERTFDMNEDFADLIDYLKIIDSTKNMPILVMQFDSQPFSSIDVGTGIDQFRARLQEAAEQHVITSPMRHQMVSFEDISSFKDAMGWLIKSII